jgi:superfamily I DNA/RNA helicase
LIRPEDTTIVLGPPGTGKTTHLIGTMEQEMKNGTPPNRIAYVSFTKRAVDEAMTRAIEKFGFVKGDLPHFRTFHSMAFRALGITRDRVFGFKNREEIANHLGLRFSRGNDAAEGGVPSGHYNGDRYSFLDSFSRARRMKPEDAWRELADEDMNWWEFKRYLDTMRAYKKERNLWEFQDMIDEFSAQELKVDIDVAIIDEAQDLSTAQWQLMEMAFRGAKRVYIAGDDDQAIYQWSGADVSRFIHTKGKVISLKKSHRLPKSIWSIAHDVAGRINERLPKDWSPRDEEGSVTYHNSLDGVELGSGEWLLLARNTYHLRGLVSLSRDLGIPYTYRGESVIDPLHIAAIKAWESRRKGRELSQDEIFAISQFTKGKTDETKIWHEALVKIPMEERVYYISLLRRGESLTRQPRVHINTVHGIKGGESENVLLLTDMTKRTYDGMEKNYDSEARVMYVGITRAKNHLHIVQPQGPRGFMI